MLSPIDHELILLVEDDGVQLELIRMYLVKSFPHLVLITCGNGKEALDFLYKKDCFAANIDLCPSLILMDDEMPIMSGIEACELMRANKSLCRIPIVIHSSEYKPANVKRAYQAGANSYVVKSTTSSLPIQPTFYCSVLAIN